MRVAILIIGLFLLCGCTGVFLQPDGALYTTPREGGFAYHDFLIETAGEPALYGWVVEPRGEKRGTILHLHGNAQNMSAHLPGVAWLAARGYEVYLVDYRGYGNSKGSSDIAGAHVDVARAVNYVAARSGGRFAIFGQSLGAAFALKVLSEGTSASQVCALVAEAPFSSYRRIAREKAAALWLVYPFQWPIGWLFSDEYAPIDHAGAVTVPVLLGHSLDDQIVPYHHGQDLLGALPHAELLTVESAPHGGVFAGGRERERFVGFVNASCGWR